ncbi:hypothetical protein [Bifidobacterium sp. ESL0790]|uniref:hypothetical protein n=1 Tax=Bifidobacterium sp. ESL0790 TaxID=2983233 RepID=UPI0023F7527A|nr:hypothetical protein [Bifidobacterium sp. ESL0790]WEV72429.1 hypothetical protein OZY47_00040 [Bifidobacterium sp. ESL0790]
MRLDTGMTAVRHLALTPLGLRAYGSATPPIVLVTLRRFCHTFNIIHRDRPIAVRYIAGGIIRGDIRGSSPSVARNAGITHRGIPFAIAQDLRQALPLTAFGSAHNARPVVLLHAAGRAALVTALFDALRISHHVVLSTVRPIESARSPAIRAIILTDIHQARRTGVLRAVRVCGTIAVEGAGHRADLLLPGNSEIIGHHIALAASALARDVLGSAVRPAMHDAKRTDDSAGIRLAFAVVAASRSVFAGVATVAFAVFADFLMAVVRTLAFGATLAGRAISINGVPGGVIQGITLRNAL